MTVPIFFGCPHTVFGPPRQLFTSRLGGRAQTSLLPWGGRRPPRPPAPPGKASWTPLAHKRALYERRGNMKSWLHGTCCPITPTCKTSFVVTATTFTLFKANIQRGRPLAANTEEILVGLASTELLNGFGTSPDNYIVPSYSIVKRQVQELLHTATSVPDWCGLQHIPYIRYTGSNG